MPKGVRTWRVAKGDDGTFEVRHGGLFQAGGWTERRHAYAYIDQRKREAKTRSLTLEAQTLLRITKLSDLEMADGDGARAIAREALERLGIPV